MIGKVWDVGADGAAHLGWRGEWSAACATASNMEQRPGFNLGLLWRASERDEAPSRRDT